MRAIFAAAIAAGLLAAGSAEACRSADHQRKLLFADQPPLGRRDELVLDVEIVRIRDGYVWAAVRDVRHGAFSGREVRVDLRPASTCGPRPDVGDRGLLIGRLEIKRDGRPALLPRTESNIQRRRRESRE